MKAAAPLQHEVPKAAVTTTASKTTLNPLQLKAENEEPLLQAKQNPLAATAYYQNPLQLQSGERAQPNSNNPLQLKENKTGLPNNLKAGVEALSGYSMDDVRVHYNSDKPAKLQAYAYAQGTDIHLDAGQEKYLPHELWHVVQQKQGSVVPTMQMKDKSTVNDDALLEKEADVMAAKASTVAQDVFFRQGKYQIQSRWGLGSNNQKFNPKGQDQAKLQDGIAGSGKGTIQLSRKRKQKLGRRGAIIGASVGTIIPIIGNTIGYFAGKKIGESIAKPKVYANHQAKHLEQEQQNFRQYQQQREHEKELYSRGAIIPFGKGQDEDFHALLRAGMCLYTYDTNYQLTIGTPQENKHAVVAGGKDVLVAGTVAIKYTPEEQDYLQYKEYYRKYKLAGKLVEELAPQIEKYNQDLKVPPNLNNEELKSWLKENHPDFFNKYLPWFDATDQLFGYIQYLDSEKEHINFDLNPLQEKNPRLVLTNDSGHYRPGANSKYEAFEAWQHAGYSNLEWSEVRTR